MADSNNTNAFGTDETLSGSVNTNWVKAWTPARDIQDLTQANTNVEIDSVKSGLAHVTTNINDLTTTLTTVTGAPKQVTGVSAVESPYKTTSNLLVSLVAVDFTPVPGDPYFDGVQIYFTGYNGSSEPQLMAQGTTSPVQFLCQTTHETVTVTVVAVSAAGVRSDFATAPTTTVALDGVVSAPPAPSIAQPRVALIDNTGWQFAFNLLGGLEADLIQSYWVYHSTTNTTPVPPANRYKQYLQSTTNFGVQTVEELTSQNMYYWVSAVNQQGLESSLTPVPFNTPGGTPSPVTLTNTYIPVTSTNGWSAHTQVQYCEPQDADNGSNFSTCKFNALAFSNPSFAYDGSQSTAAVYTETHHADYAGCIWSFSSFPGITSGSTVTAASFSITTDVLATSGISGEAAVYYSTDNGVTWNSVYVWNAHNTGIGARLKHTDTVTLSTSTDFTKLKVMANAHSHDDLCMDVYEISLSVTTNGIIVPDKVSGVSITLASGNVQISWSGETPLSRTDITNYYVYRALHGAGFPTASIQGTVTPAPPTAIYTWVDSSAHDGTYDYWIVAQNASGLSQPSNVAHLGSASGTLYSTGATVEFMRPVEPLADVTGLHTSADTSAVNGRAASDVSSTINSGGGIDFSSSLHTNKTLDNIADGSSYYRVPSTIFGGPSAVISPTGSIRLKNSFAVPFTTLNPTVSTSGFADLPELGSSNSSMTITTHGNPVLFGANLSFYSATGSSTSGPVTDIGVSFTGTLSYPNYPPTITISISGDGTGAGAGVSWTTTGTYPSLTFTPHLTITGGSGYTHATATVTISGASGAGGYTNGTNSYSCTIGTGSPVANVPIQVRILMDGAAVFGPVQITTDSTGNVTLPCPLSLQFPSATSHTFQVQAWNVNGTYTVTSTNRSFQFLEIGVIP